MGYTNAEEPKVTLFMPTWNAGPEFFEIFEKMKNQKLDRPFEILVIDSGSQDGTVAFLKKQGVRLIEISNKEFNHGLTRNRGIQEARGEIVVLATQDAKPNDEFWMQRLVDCYEDPLVAGAYSRQLPRPDANPFIKDRLSSWAAAKEEPRVQMIQNREEFDSLPPLEKLGRVAFDNVSSSVRKSIATEIPFRERQFGEDLDWGHRAILAGYKIVFEPGSKVIHSHNNSIWYEFKRVYLDHQNLNRIFGVHTIPRWKDVFSCSWHAMGHLAKVVSRDRDLSILGKLWWWFKVPFYGFSQNLAQFLGARSVRKLTEGSKGYQRIDRRLRRGV
jgi:rhamnosyltransferase